jgi:Zn-dependent M28 family amino/carboxypeptidase
MIGDKELTIKREGQSTSWLVNLIWEAARAGGRDNVFVKDEHFISDDHLPFVEARVPSVDLIDFDYGPDHSYWHTNEDTLDKISGESMKIVGDVIIRALPALYKRLNQNTLLQKKSG